MYVRVAFTVVALTIVGSVPARAQVREPPVDWLNRCLVSGVQAWCGEYEVWENRAAQSGRRVPLRVIVVPARSGSASADPFVYLMGGPGGAATPAAAGIANGIGPMLPDRDILLVDQRGTGSSNALECEAPGDEAPLQSYFNEMYDPDDVRACLAAQDADVSQYTTPIAMDDLDEVRAALGYEQLNLFGGSYGTRAALIYLRRHPDRVRTVTIKGVAPTSMKNPLPFARALDRGVAATIEACAAEEACNAAYPDLAEEWERVTARFEEGPVTATVEHAETNRRGEVTITRGVFADGVRHVLYTMNGARDLPTLIHAAANGDFSPFAQVELNQNVGFSNLLSEGMFLTVTCAEDVRFITEEDVERETAETFLGDYRIRRQQAACEVWPQADIGPEYMHPVRAGAPVLLISGALDTATPWEGGAAVAEHLENALHLVVPNQSHGTVNPQCEFGLVIQFIRQGGFDGLDTSCIDETRRPPFNISPVP